MKMLNLKKPKAVMIQIKSEDIFLQSVTKQIYVSSNTVGSFLVSVRNRKPRQIRLLEQHTKRVITACWSVSNMKYPEILPME